MTTPTSLPGVALYRRAADGTFAAVDAWGAGLASFGVITDTNFQSVWNQVRFSPDGRWLALGMLFNSGVQIARFRPTETPPLELVVEHQIQDEAGNNLYDTVRLAWSPDSKYLAALCGPVRIWQVDGDTITQIAGPSAETTEAHTASWAPGEALHSPSSAGAQTARLTTRKAIR